MWFNIWCWMGNGLAKVKVHAAAAGFPGEYPPPLVPMKELGDWENALDELEGGNHRAAICNALGSGFMAFFMGIDDAHMRRLARSLLDVALKKKNYTRSRLRSIETSLKPLSLLADILTKTAKQGGTSTVELDHCMQLIHAFNAEIGVEGFRKLSGVLVSLSETGVTVGKDSASDRVKVTAVTMGILGRATKAYRTFRDIVDLEDGSVGKNNPASRKRAADRLKEIEVEVTEASDARD